jgi:hypothetical protein
MDVNDTRSFWYNCTHTYPPARLSPSICFPIPYHHVAAAWPQATCGDKTRKGVFTEMSGHCTGYSSYSRFCTGSTSNCGGYEDNLVGVMPTGTLADCQDACDAHSSCFAIAYNKAGTCSKTCSVPICTIYIGSCDDSGSGTETWGAKYMHYSRSTVAKTSVTDTDCGSNYVYDPSKSASPCAGATCDASGADKATCCVAQVRGCKRGVR